MVVWACDDFLPHSYVDKGSDDDDDLSDDDLDLMDEEEAAMMAAASAAAKEEPQGECIERIMTERRGRVGGKSE